MNFSLRSRQFDAEKYKIKEKSIPELGFKPKFQLYMMACSPLHQLIKYWMLVRIFLN